MNGVMAWSLLLASQVQAPTEIDWVPSPHHSGRGGTVLDAIVIHTTEGSSSGISTIKYFANPKSKVSSHYIISSTGKITQMVALDQAAFHATYYNKRSIGVDIAGKAGNASTWTKENLAALTQLVAWLCQEYKIPVVHPPGDAYGYPNDKLDVPGIVAHGQVQPWNRTDPGKYFPWASFIQDVQKLVEPPKTAVAGADQVEMPPTAGGGCSGPGASQDGSWLLMILFALVPWRTHSLRRNRSVLRR